MAVIWIMTTVLLATSAVAADIVIANRMAASLTAGGDGVRAYQYGTGVEHVFDDETEFGSGTITGAATVVGDSVQIDGVGSELWWDAMWRKRQCFEVSAPVSLGQYPIRVVVDTTGLAVDDLRVVPVTSPASAATPLLHYVEPDVGTAATSVWFQAPIGAAQNFCVYFDSMEIPNPGSTSDEFAPFTATNGQTVSYYTMTNAYTGNGINGRVQVVSYVDGNVVSDGTTTVTLNTGGSHVFSRLDEDGVITATGPIDASYNRSNRESLLPEGFADSQFVFPTSRARQQFWVRSPHGATTVEAVVNGAVIASVAVPNNNSVVLNADVGGNNFVTLRSIDGTDFLASHKATTSTDTFHGVPWFGDDLVGVASQFLKAGSPTSGSVLYESSIGVSASLALSPAGVTTIGANGSRGNGRGYRLSGGSQFHVIQQADDNGFESTSFLPRRLLSQTFRVPIDHSYVAVACPVSATTVVIGGATFDCDTGAGVGHVRRGLGNYPAGTLIEADHPIFVYYESRSGSDEHNIYGAKGAIPYVGDVVVVSGPVEVQPDDFCAVWRSPIFATSDVFGLASIDVDGTSFSFRISFDGGAFIGPDGTDASSFDARTAVPFSVDGSTSAQIEVDFCGAAGDQLRSVGFECELAEVVEGAAVVIANDGPILRVYPNDPGAASWVQLETTTNPDSYQLSTSVNGVHIEAMSGLVTNPAPEFTAEPYSVLFAGLSPQTSQLSINLVEQSGVRLEVPVVFDIAS